MNKLNDDGYDIAREIKELNCIGSDPATDVAQNFVNISFELGTYSAQSEHPSRSK